MSLWGNCMHKWIAPHIFRRGPTQHHHRRRNQQRVHLLHHQSSGEIVVLIIITTARDMIDMINTSWQWVQYKHDNPRQYSRDVGKETHQSQEESSAHNFLSPTTWSTNVCWMASLIHPHPSELSDLVLEVRLLILPQSARSSHSSICHVSDARRIVLGLVDKQTITIPPPPLAIIYLMDRTDRTKTNQSCSTKIRSNQFMCSGRPPCFKPREHVGPTSTAPLKIYGKDWKCPCSAQEIWTITYFTGE